MKKNTLSAELKRRLLYILQYGMCQARNLARGGSTQQVFELLDALEWDSSLHPEHAHSLIRNLFKQVHDHSVSLSNRIRSGAGNPDSVAHVISHDTQSLRQNLAMLTQVLAARQTT